MDLLQKHGLLKHNPDKSVARREEAQQQQHKSQQEVNSLLGNFGQSHHDHPDRRSSGAGNMANDIEEMKRRLSNGESLDRKD